MSYIKIEYRYNGEPYTFIDDQFDYEHIMDIAKGLQKDYEPFANKINAEGGYIELNISRSEILTTGIHYEAFVKGISEALLEEIRHSAPNDY